MKLHRRPDWEERLTDLVARSFNRPFRYGEFDCLLFVCEGIELMTDVDLSLGLRGQYADGVGAAMAIRRAGGEDIIDLARRMAARWGLAEIPPALAGRGDAALAELETSTTFGLSVGAEVLCPSAHGGLVGVSTDLCSRAWKI